MSSHLYATIAEMERQMVEKDAELKRLTAELAKRPRWVSLEERKPETHVPTMFWGSRLNDDDYPSYGEVCECDGQVHLEMWLIDDLNDRNCGETSEHYTERMIGTPTHWLDWSTVPDGDNE
jgi:hypothetical protein